MGQLVHPNIVRLVGHTNTPSHAILILELMEMDLLTFYKNEILCEFPMREGNVRGVFRFGVFFVFFVVVFFLLFHIVSF